MKKFEVNLVIEDIEVYHVEAEDMEAAEMAVIRGGLTPVRIHALDAQLDPTTEIDDAVFLQAPEIVP